MADLKEKTYVEDVDRSVYDIRDTENDAYRMESGLTPEIVEKLSKEKDDPVWMQQLVDAFVNRDACAERKQQNRNDETPEIQLHRVPKRMFLIRWTLRPLQSDQQ